MNQKTCLYNIDVALKQKWNSDAYSQSLGQNLNTIAAVANYGVSTVRKAVQAVANVINIELKDTWVATPESEDEWCSVSSKFEQKCALPNVLGAIGLLMLL